MRETTELQTSLKLVNITDKVTKIKINEVISLASKLKSSKVITESQVLSLLRYYELYDELNKVFK